MLLRRVTIDAMPAFVTGFDTIRSCPRLISVGRLGHPQTYCGYRVLMLAPGSKLSVFDRALETEERKSLANYARAEGSRAMVRPVIGLLISSFLYAYLSPAIAVAWLAALLVNEAAGYWLCRRFASGNFRYSRAIYANALASSLIWITHALLLWNVGGMVTHIAAVMNLMSVSFFAALGSYYSRKLFLTLILPQLTTLSYLLISYLSAHATPFVALAASLATLGACGTILLNSFILNATERKLMRSNEELARAAEAARLASEAKSSFLATMSHEIRTPLNGILGMAQAMTLGDLSQEQRARLNVIKESGDNLLTVLNDILDEAKIEAGMLTLESVEFDLTALLESATAPFERLATAKGLTLAVQLGEGSAGSYLGDPTRLRQILYNLISNAIKFSPAGSITLASDYQDGTLRLSVADTGIGIPADRLGALFQPFTQAETSTTRNFGGTGLGLSICSRLAGLMDGDIAVRSTQGEGSVFTLSIPCVPVSASGAVAQGEHEAITDDAQPVEQAENSRSPRILAVEDNEINQLVLRTLLGHGGFTPTLASNGMEAVETFASGDWDLVLMDINMPVMGGIEATRQIRALELKTGRARTPILALTADALAHQVAEYGALGFDGHVAKPLEVSALFAAIDEAMRPDVSGRQEAEPSSAVMAGSAQA
ncbi:MAG: hybrid sensor histidine kinase/response regulator [Alphaproteobacteria bacterium PA2]|nr:MAG: hybrid sensor histidine kinase/response regulator [Alphaproteobacteria bacterium PA2]